MILRAVLRVQFLKGQQTHWRGIVKIIREIDARECSARGGRIEPTWAGTKVALNVYDQYTRTIGNIK